MVVAALQWLKWLVAGVLFLATFFIVTRMVKLAVLARRQEIEVMQLVGATETLIQAPLAIEGLFQGLLGSGGALAILWGVYRLLRDDPAGLSGLIPALSRIEFLDGLSIVLILSIGADARSFGELICVTGDGSFVESFSSRALIAALLLVIAARGELPGAVADKDLEGIKRRIQNEKKGLSQLQIKEGGVLKSLGKIEDDLERKSRELKIADARYTSILGTIHKTEVEAERLRGSISQREDWFRQRAVALYRWQRSGNPFWFVDGANRFDCNAATQTLS